MTWNHSGFFLRPATISAVNSCGTAPPRFMARVTYSVLGVFSSSRAIDAMEQQIKAYELVEEQNRARYA